MRQMTSFKVRQQAGLTLIELMIAIAISAAIMFGVFYLVGKAQSKRVTSEQAQALNMMASDTRTKFAAQGGYTGVSPKVLIDNAIPQKNMINGANIVSGWNTTIQVAPSTLYTSNDAVAFTYAVPSDDCSDFVSTAESSFARVTVGSVKVKDVTSGANALDVVGLGTGCQSAGGSNVSIKFEQGR